MDGEARTTFSPPFLCANESPPTTVQDSYSEEVSEQPTSEDQQSHDSRADAVGGHADETVVTAAVEEVSEQPTSEDQQSHDSRADAVGGHADETVVTAAVEEVSEQPTSEDQQSHDSRADAVGGHADETVVTAAVEGAGEYGTSVASSSRGNNLNDADSGPASEDSAPQHLLNRKRRWKLRRCASCGRLRFSHFACDICGISFCSEKCGKESNTACVPSFFGGKHHWVPHSLHFPSPCVGCGKRIHGFFAPCLRCSRCGKFMHTDCLGQSVNHVCQPWFVKEGSAEATSSPFPPALAFVNTKSGGKQGDSLIRRLRRQLGADQVVNLVEKVPDSQGRSKVVGPVPALQKYGAKEDLRVFACGGDGTVSWTLGGMDAVADLDAPVGVIPLGTGNDLARNFGWGGGYRGGSVKAALQRLFSGRVVSLDKWNLSCENEDEHSEGESVGNQLQPPGGMMNYFGLGLDSKISLAFHEAREKYPGRFTSQIGNKCWYAVYGLMTMLRSRSISRNVKLEVDGEEVDLPERCASIVLLNIQSMAGGALNGVWGRTGGEARACCDSHAESFDSAHYGDGKLEVVAYKSAWHLVGIMMGLRHGIRLKQGKEVTLRVHGESGYKIAGEVDGEAWEQGRGTLRFSFNRSNKIVRG